MEIDKVMEELKLTDILNDKGKRVLSAMAHMSLRYKTNNDSRIVSSKIFDVIEGTGWLTGAMAMLFTLDMLLQNNPFSLLKDDESAINNMFEELEQKFIRKDDM